MKLKINWTTATYIVCICAITLSCDKKRNDEKGETIAPEKKPTEETVLSRQTLLENIADHFVLPGYANFKLKLDYMDSQRKAFTDNPNNTNLVAFRSAWVDAYTEWQKIAMFNVGPAETYLPTSFFNSFPTNAAQIEANIISTPNLDLPSAYSQQGFPALDYLINGLGSDSATIARYTTASDASKRITYLTTLTEKMKTLFNTINEGWISGGYRAKFIGNTALNAGTPTSLFVNAFVFHYEKHLRTYKIANPADAFGHAGSTFPTEVEAYYKKDLSKTLAKASHQAVIDVFNGKSFKTRAEVYSIKAYLNELGTIDSKTKTNLSDIINAQFVIVNSKLDALSDNFSTQITSDNQKMLDAFDAMQTAVRLLKIDMTSAMSVTITYVDTDGD